MKKILTITISFFLLSLLLVGCGEEDVNETEEDYQTADIEDLNLTLPGIKPVEKAEPLKNITEEEINETEEEEEKASAKTSTNFADAKEESFFFAKTNIEHLVLGSCMGEKYELYESGKMQIILDTSGYEDVPIIYPCVINNIYSSGDPELIVKDKSKLDEKDWPKWKWDEVTFENKISPAVMARTMLAEIELAKYYSTKTDRISLFMALLLADEISMQVRYTVDYLRMGNGFYGSIIDGKLISTDSSEFNPIDSALVLWAFSDIAKHSKSDFYISEDIDRKALLAYSDQIFNAIMKYQTKNDNFMNITTSEDLSLMIISYAHFAQQTNTKKWQVNSIKEASAMADMIINRMDKDGEISNNLKAQSISVSGLAHAYRLTADDKYKDAAKKAWKAMDKMWDNKKGVYKTSGSDYNYDIETIGNVIAGLNAAKNILDEDISSKYSSFFANVILNSGIQLSEFEQSGGDTDKDSVPLPGDVFQAPVFASKVKLDTNWDVTDKTFSSEGAMWTSLQLLWMGEQDGDALFENHGVPTVVPIR